ncbi:acyl-CoA thioesterase [Alteromonas sp. ASW11-130]|uniref:acyl-CoA thioesterase n=1 Tax=Alteromonas sp. ASW11-130 TaxID=3015775 RepID=UPI0022420614|nr:acyl-CoA thioesterase [Alteromonas sp. ASW11-130]MCW8092572.1 acyl-CoA thioesterase [Alteromonas sp. ASW11-130]
MSEIGFWKYPSPYIEKWQIAQAHLDHYQHVNNVAYLSQLEKVAWAHSNFLGLHFTDYAELDRGMVIRRHELDYLAPCYLDDELACATWIVSCERALSLTREFQFYCPRRSKMVFAAKTQFICVSMTSGAPKRMPEKFQRIYGNACIAEKEAS